MSFYVTSTGTGLTEILPLGVTLSLDGATLVGNAVADADGNASLIATLPVAEELALQAAETGHTSNWVFTGDGIFADAFESGDTSAWSGQQP